jgi:hypothetical protein
VAVFGWFVKREIKRIDLALADSVRKQEFEQLREDMNERHRENLDRLDRIDTATTGTHQRIDQLYRDWIASRGKSA